MQYTHTPGKFLGALSLLLFSICDLHAQGKQPYANIAEALQSTSILRGKSGPESVNWIQGGKQYSFIANNEIHSLDPKTLQEKTIFTTSGVHFPGSDKPFNYQSFQWSHDSKHLVFKTHFR